MGIFFCPSVQRSSAENKEACRIGHVKSSMNGGHINLWLLWSKVKVTCQYLFNVQGKVLEWLGQSHTQHHVNTRYQDICQFGFVIHEQKKENKIKKQYNRNGFGLCFSQRGLIQEKKSVWLIKYTAQQAQQNCRV